MTGIIDIHAHILPGVDDGAKNWDESRKMLEEAYRQGIRHIIATPHYSRRGLTSHIYELADRLQDMARGIALDLEIGLGQETFFHEGLVENLKMGKALTLEGSRYVLVEFEPGVPYEKLYQAVRKMTMSRFIPVIAHVERYICLRKKEHLDGLIHCDCRLQMNFDSLSGNGLWDRDVRWCRKQILEGKIHYLGTDMHGVDYRKPEIEACLEWLERHLAGHELEALLKGNADRILQQRKTGE